MPEHTAMDATTSATVALLQYAPGDFGIVEEARFRKVYRPLPTA